MLNDMSQNNAPATLQVLKRIYRALVPGTLRGSHVADQLKFHMLGHDWAYNAEYYENLVEGPAARSAGTIANSIVTEFKPKRIIDVGCGTGALLEVLRNKGCQVFGLEYSEAALKVCRSRQLSVAKFDIEKHAFKIGETYDVAVSLEVAEHLPQKSADRYVDLLTQLSDIVVFTAAQPGQGGTNHVNEQSPPYWIAKFQERGLTHLDKLTQAWREVWAAAGDVEGWYHKNLMLFRNIT